MSVTADVSGTWRWWSSLVSNRGQQRQKISLMPLVSVAAIFGLVFFFCRRPGQSSVHGCDLRGRTHVSRVYLQLEMSRFDMQRADSSWITADEEPLKADRKNLGTLPRSCEAPEAGSLMTPFNMCLYIVLRRGLNESINNSTTRRVKRHASWLQTVCKFSRYSSLFWCEGDLVTVSLSLSKKWRCNSLKWLIY